MSLLKAFIICVSWINTNSFNKTCDSRASNCPNNIIQCPDDEPDCNLFVRCSGYKSCEGAFIDCTSSSECHLQCVEKLACDGLHVICPPDGICDVHCVSEEDNTCSDINITSNTNTITNVQCKGSDACYAGNIHCADSEQCNLQCYGANACGGPQSAPFTVYGDTTRALNISQCIGGTASSPPCMNMNVFCPSDEDRDQIPLTPRCYLPGNGIFNKRNSHNTEVTEGGIHIYAVHSWHDVIITDSNEDNLISGLMSCGPNNDISCNITNANGVWDCVDTKHVCAIAVYTEPTKEPTTEPTYLPTGDPTVNPTVDPTKPPTVEPTEEPSHDPTTEPTVATIAPTRSPTTSSTASPSAAPVIADTQLIAARSAYGLLVAVILFVVFVCLMVCGWRYWNKGNDVKREGERTRKKRKRKKSGDKSIQLTSDGTGTESSASMEVIQVAEVKQASDGQKKRKRNKKKKKKKKTQDTLLHDDNAGDYQKQTDDPFKNTQWTELTTFD